MSTKATIGRRFSRDSDSSDSSDDDDEPPIIALSKPVIATPGSRFLKQKEEERRVQKEEEQKNKKRDFLKTLFNNVSQGSKQPIAEMRGIYKKTKSLTKKWTKGGKRHDKLKGRNKRKGRSNRTMRGSGNCGSSGCLKPKETPWLASQNIDNGKSSRKTVYNNPKNMTEEESWDDLIKALEDENFKEQKKEEKEIVNQQVDWTAVIKAAEVANQNEKKRQEMAANERISNYKKRTQTRADEVIQRMFHRKTSKNRRRTPL